MHDRRAREGSRAFRAAPGDPWRPARHADILDDHRHTWRPNGREQSLHPLADSPEQLDLAPVARELRRPKQRPTRCVEYPERRLLSSVELARLVGAELD